MAERNLVDLPDLDRSVIEHVIYNLRNAPIAAYPFPHFQARGVFPDGSSDDFFDTFVASLDTLPYAANEDGKYKGRAFADPRSVPGLAGFYTTKFASTVLSLFGNAYHERFSGDSGNPPVTMDLRLIRDTGGYSIGPHTDARWKLVSLLFYLDGPYDTGTSIYVPRVPGTICPGGPHHPFEPFIEVHRAPFIPNSCVGFWKTDNAWHGVAPLPADSPQRDLLLYNLYAGAPKGQANGHTD
jgi:hypothetical protein